MEQCSLQTQNISLLNPKISNLRNYVRRIRSYHSTMRKKCLVVFGNFFSLLEFLQFCLQNVQSTVYCVGDREKSKLR